MSFDKVVPRTISASSYIFHELVASVVLVLFERSGLWQAVDGRVLIYIHKEQMLDDVRGRYPAEHYIFIDDKLRLLTAVKQVWQDRVTTVFHRQVHYAFSKEVTTYPPADLTIAHIADLFESVQKVFDS
jgi:hypothetical protein